jgi:mannonate dehydratase
VTLSRRNLLKTSGAGLAMPALGAQTRRGPRNYGWMPRISENLNDVNVSTLKWLKQVGCNHVVLQGTDWVDSDKKGYWSIADIQRVAKPCGEAGLKLESLMLPIDSYRAARFGLPERDRDIENAIQCVKALAACGVPRMEWRFQLDFFWGANVGYVSDPGRGGARYSGFDYRQVKDLPPIEGMQAVGADEVWKRLVYFCRPVADAAEKAGVLLSMHPNDPPVPTMRGVARVLYSADAMRRFLKEVPNANSGITLCQGTFTEMGVDVFQEIRYFATRKRLNLVHFRAVRGTVPRYVETFIDDGDIDMLQAMKTYRDSGYDGPMVSDHTPGMEGDRGFGLMGRTFSHGYMLALVHAVNAMP